MKRYIVIPVDVSVDYVLSILEMVPHTFVILRDNDLLIIATGNIDLIKKLFKNFNVKFEDDTTHFNI